MIPLARAGDEAAFRWIVETHGSDMRQVAFVVCGDIDLAEEAVAAAWPIAWRKLDALREAASLRSWLVAIAANEARHLARGRAKRSIREIAVGDRDLDATPHRPFERSGLHDGSGVDLSASIDLAVALSRLDPSDRALLALRYVAGLNSTELASATGLTPSGTRARLQRLLGRLRVELRDDE
jgi:RNA polymerase sigma-70 factor (ECF subfamily)